MNTTKPSPKSATLLAQACTKVQGFSDMYRHFKRRMSTSGRSTSTLSNYARHIAQMALYFNCRPTDLEDDQIEDYLYVLQQQHNTPSETYFKPICNLATLNDPRFNSIPIIIRPAT
ncbi:phage integrase N-terminal SAM-like domain-containing protein [Foetidibacter luteolus]|uniref:phage integrase N-terminal SAM-like domain-containing protein n=1 Tax=Foetidibacter luteolus TaxID=2608880 RepID=UPI00129AF831|nr:phage integrase N-terminal SAM-like domain-containing protein [Foetidibacter luteolus]